MEGICHPNNIDGFSFEFRGAGLHCRDVRLQFGFDVLLACRDMPVAVFCWPYTALHGITVPVSLSREPKDFRTVVQDPRAEVFGCGSHDMETFDLKMSFQTNPMHSDSTEPAMLL